MRREIPIRNIENLSTVLVVFTLGCLTARHDHARAGRVGRKSGQDGGDYERRASAQFYRGESYFLNRGRGGVVTDPH